MAEAKRARRMALVAAAGGVEPLGTGSPCADCGPRSPLSPSKRIHLDTLDNPNTCPLYFTPFTPLSKVSTLPL